MTTIAILDKKSRLIGLQRLEDEDMISEGVVVPEEMIPEDAVFVVDECDLPVDGTYKWMPEDKGFMPVGHGLGKPGPAPISTETVVLLLAANMTNPPQEMLDWMKWYRGLSET